MLQINGSPTDAAAGLIKKGIHAGLDNSGYPILAEFDTPDWAPPKAQEWAGGQITRFGKNILGVVAANDGTGGGAIAAFKAAGVDPVPPVTGNDATIAALQLVIAGDQYNTISKPSEIVAAAAANVAVQLLSGETPKAETTLYDTPSQLFIPAVITPRTSRPRSSTRSIDKRRGALHRPLCRRLQEARHRQLIAIEPASGRRSRRPDVIARGTSFEKDAAMTDISGGATATGELVLSLRGISKNFGAVSALTDIDLDVHAGEVVALVGDNGAGKSTLVKILAGVHQPSSGTISFRGKPVTMRRSRARRSASASRPCSRIWRFARTSTSSPTSFSAGSSVRSSSTRWPWSCAPGRC